MYPWRWIEAISAEDIVERHCCEGDTEARARAGARRIDEEHVRIAPGTTQTTNWTDCSPHDGVSTIPSAPKHSDSGPELESSWRHTVDDTSGGVLLLVIVMEAAMPVCPTVTEVGNVGPTERIAPAATGLDGTTPMPHMTASTTIATAHRFRFRSPSPTRSPPRPPMTTRTTIIALTCRA